MHELLERKKGIRRNILIVDDVFTSGSTVRSMVNLIKTKHPKRIEILIIAKTTRE